MAAKTVDNSFNATIAKSFYNYIKNTDLDDTFYASVVYIPQTEYTTYSGASVDSDSESEFWGGTVVDGYDETDRTFYSQNTISMHKIFPGGISRVVKRNDWQPNIRFPAWPATGCHVMVKEYVSGYARLNVYRCLFTPNTDSLYSPSGVSASEIYLPDGYVWKYLYTISNSEAQRFLNDEWMPVPEKVTNADAQSLATTTTRYNQYVVQENAVAGEVYGFNIDSDLATAAVVAAGGSLSVVAKPTTSTIPEQKFEATLTYDSLKNEVKATLIQKGKGYDGQLTFVDKATELTTIPGVSGSLLRGLGHGSDAPSEMFASNILLISRNIPDGDLLKVINENEFNAIALVKNPIDATTRTTAVKDFYVACKSLQFDTPSTFLPGDELKPFPSDDGRRGIVTSVYNDQAYYLSYKKDNENDTFLDSEQVSNLTSTKISTVMRSVDREVLFDSGEMLIFDKKGQILTRSADQIEVLTFIMNF